MDEAMLYELVTEAVVAAMDARDGGNDIALHKRLIGGRVLFEDDEGREVRAIPVESLFKKVTSVRDKLRVLEQKVNSNKALDAGEKAEMQGYITKAYGSLTTFNFLFAEEGDKFRGTGG